MKMFTVPNGLAPDGMIAKAAAQTTGISRNGFRWRPTRSRPAAIAVGAFWQRPDEDDGRHVALTRSWMTRRPQARGTAHRRCVRALRDHHALQSSIGPRKPVEEPLRLRARDIAHSHPLNRPSVDAREPTLMRGARGAGGCYRARRKRSRRSSRNEPDHHPKQAEGQPSAAHKPLGLSVNRATVSGLQAPQAPPTLLPLIRWRS